MSLQLPRVLKNFNFYPDGRSYAGRFAEVTPPVLAMVLDEHRAAGMDAPKKIELGMEALTLTGVLNDKDPDIMAYLGRDGVQYILRQSVGAQGRAPERVVITMRGMLTRIEPAALSPGTKTADNLTFELDYFKYEQGGVERVEIDILNMVRRIGGVDQLAADRDNIGL